MIPPKNIENNTTMSGINLKSPTTRRLNEKCGLILSFLNNDTNKKIKSIEET